MPDPIKAMEMMNQLSLDYGDEPVTKSRAPRNEDPETKRKFDEKLEEAKTEREAQKNLRKIESNRAKAEIADMAEQHRAEKAKANTYTKSYSGNTRGGGGSGTGGTAADNKMLLNPRAMKKGGAVKSASSRADGCAIRGKTRA